jgi:folylpolyglutamate synthase/dihydropteroate synthase
MLHQAGYRVGMFVSPYLGALYRKNPNRFQEIPREELANLTRQVKEQD